MISIPKGDVPFDTIHVDHFGPLAKTQCQYQYILVIIDAYTKCVKLFPCTTTKTKPAIKHLEKYFQNYSKPRRLVSDRRTCFTSSEFEEFLDGQDIQHILIAPGVPRANGQVEVVNRSIRSMFAKLANTKGSWQEVLVDVEFVLNNTINCSTGFTPSNLLFGINQKGRISDNLRVFLETFQESNRDMGQKRELAAENIIKAQNYSKAYYDNKHKESSKYNVGDYVMLSNVDVTPGVNKKLIPKFKGPYVVDTVLDNDRYVVSDIPGFQVTSIPYRSTVAPCRMKLYSK